MSLENIAIRLLIALIVAVYFYRRKESDSRLKAAKGCDSGQCLLHNYTVGKQNTPYHDIGISYEGPKMKFAGENWLDRLCKKLGIAYEIQTGDPSFDEKVYIISDDEAVGDLLEQDPMACKIISDVLAGGFSEIITTGKHMWFTGARGSGAGSTDLLKIVELRNRLNPLEAENLRYSYTRIPSRISLLDAFTAGVVVYAVAGGLNDLFFFGFRDYDLFVRGSDVVFDGFIWGYTLLALFVAWGVLLLKGSSRSHRAILSNFWVLLFALPAFAMVLITDFNLSLDTTSNQVAAQIHRKWSHTSTDSKGRKSTSYYVDLDVEKGNYSAIKAHIDSSYTMSVSSSFYGKVSKGKEITVTLGDGYLRYPWIRSVSY